MIKIALIGASVRVGAFVHALVTDYAKSHCIAAVMDIDPGRLRGFCQHHGLDVPVYTDFDLLCREIRPDLVIVTTVDSTHSEYIVRALDAKIGCISEKPLCISVAQCRDILAAHRRNPEVFAVTSHNSRYRPVARTLKSLLSEGVIGRVLRADYTEMLDRVHGKSYFRRWNSRRKYSNGLELHKSTHHFDKMNYLLGTRAVEVAAAGTLHCYGAAAPHDFTGSRCHECIHQSECPDSASYDHEFYQSEIYTPDLCIYSPEIDIEDDYSASILFENGVLASYSLCAHASYEGEIIVLEGETGRLEARQTFYRLAGNSSDLHDETIVPEESVVLFRPGAGGGEALEIRHGSGSHGGADSAIFRELFAVPPSPELPTLEDGIQAVLTGCAVVESIRTGRKVYVQKML